MTDVELVIALRSTESRSKRALLDEAADRLEQLAVEAHKSKECRMDAAKFIETANRMCRYYGQMCFECPLYQTSEYACCINPDRAGRGIEAVERWAREHSAKTRQAVFLERYPYAGLDNDGYLGIKPCVIDTNFAGYLNTAKCMEMDCTECRRNYWMEEAT